MAISLTTTTVGMAGLALAVLLVSATDTQAALRCSDEDTIVEAAPTALQIVPSLIEAPAAESELCRVQGEVVRSFRGPHPVGTLIEMRISCRGGWTSASGEPVVVLGSFVPMADLQSAAVIELYLTESGFPASGGTGVVLLGAPTDAPARQSACED